MKQNLKFSSFLSSGLLQGLDSHKCLVASTMDNTDIKHLQRHKCSSDSAVLERTDSAIRPSFEETTSRSVPAEFTNTFFQLHFFAYFLFLSAKLYHYYPTNPLCFSLDQWVGTSSGSQTTQESPTALTILRTE